MESCYCASIEMCLEVLPLADYLVASEGPHSRCAIIQSHTMNRLLQLSNKATSLQLALCLAESFIQKIDSYLPRDKDVLELGCDIAVIDLRAFEAWFPRLCLLQLNHQSRDTFKRCKVHPKLKPEYLGYDVCHALFASGRFSPREKERLWKEFCQVVCFYRQSKYLRQKNYASRSYGLCWSPAPYDSEQGSSYKYTRAFTFANDLTIY